MPELPEVETICRGLATRMEGRRLVKVQQFRPDLRLPLPDDLPARLTGRQVVTIGRRAKYILVRFDDAMVLVIHLGMSGRMVIGNDPDTAPGRHDHVIFYTDDGGVVRFNDARRFGLMALCRGDALDSHPLLAHLGPEPLGNDFSGPVLAAALGRGQRSVKAALLDQSVVAGLGNIYVCEALFRAGISPQRVAAALDSRAVDRLVTAIRAVLREAIAAGGSTLRDYVQSSGELGYFQHRFSVYGRAGQPCPGCTCDVSQSGGVQRIVQNNRSTFFCPRRQC